MPIQEKRTGTARQFDKFRSNLEAMMLSAGITDGKVVFKDVHGYHSFVDPTNSNLIIHSFLVNIRNFPFNLINDAKHNCRTDGLKLGKDHLALKEKIAVNEAHLSLDHSGITASSENEVSHRAGTVTVDGDAFIRNGGHSTRILQELFVEGRLPKNQWLKIEIVEGKMNRNQSVSFSIARNTGKPLDARSANNLSGKFNWIQDRLRDKPYANKIAYQQGQDDNLHPIDVKQILQIIDFCNASKYKGDDTANASLMKPRIVMGEYGKNVDPFKAMCGILPDLLELHDGIEDIILEHLGNNIGTKKYSYLARARERGSFTAFFSGKQRRGQVNGGSIAPFLSSLRVFMQVRNGDVSWRGGWNVAAILGFYRNVMPGLIEMTVKNEDIKSATTMARNTSFWHSVYSKVETAFLKLK